MFRYLIAIFFCVCLACCQKTPTSITIIEQSFDVTKENEDGLIAIRSIAFEAKAWSDSSAASKEQGWNAVRSSGETISAATSFTDRNEELMYYGRVIFQNLGFPLQDTPGSLFSLETNQTAAIRHNREALARFEQLLKRWRRSPEERFNDLLNGRQ